MLPKGSQCLSDNDCSTRKFCIKSQDEKPFCATCCGLQRRCPRNAMYCPGTLCMIDVCTTMEEATQTLERQIDAHDDIDTKGTNEHPIQENKPKRKPNIKKSQGTKEILFQEEGESCLRTSNHGPGLCCAHHFWTEIKPVLLEGQVCSWRGYRDTAQAPEILLRWTVVLGCERQSQGPGNQQHAW
ncbi:LOW QUALITY PROTEIN: dickkopf-related protein 4 [Rhynchonycteris naso]